MDARSARHPLRKPVRPVPSLLRLSSFAHPILEVSLLAPLFSNGQVIETFRGRGIYQPSLDRAISLLDDSRWIHIFPEGKVNQDESIGRANLELLRFRWGVSRLTMETEKLPYVVPMWLQGFDTIMPENRGFPRPLPRLFPRRSISITFGAPLEPDDPKRLPLLRSYRSKLGTPTLGIPHLPSSRIPKPGRHPDSLNSDTTLARACRIQVAEWLRQEVQRLGTEVRQGTGDGQRGGRRRGFGGPGVETVR